MADPQFNPLQTIISLEQILNNKIELPNNFKNYIIETINIINTNDTIDKINNYVKSHPINTNNNNDNPKDINVEITQIIPKVKKLCNTDNMMNHFIYVVDLMNRDKL
jgi:hypothetical protein